MNSIDYILLAAILLVLAAWYFLRQKPVSGESNAVLQELREQLSRRDSELAVLRESNTSLNSGKTSAEAMLQAAERNLISIRDAATEAERLRSAEQLHWRTDREQLTGLLAQAEAHRNSLLENKQDLLEATAKMTRLTETQQQELAKKSEALVQAQTELANTEAQFKAERATSGFLQTTLEDERAARAKATEQSSDEAGGLRRNLGDRERELAETSAQLQGEREKGTSLTSSVDELKTSAAAAATTAAKERQLLQDELKTSRETLSQAQTDLVTAQVQLKGERTQLSETREQLATTQRNHSHLQEELLTSRTAASASEAEKKMLKERLDTERQQLTQLQDKIRQEFEGISNKLLADSSSRFNQQSSESLEKLLAPLRENLTTFKTALDGTKQETATQTALLKDQIQRISTDATNLVKALKGDSKVLGNWGENMLDQLLEKSGLQRNVHYRRQHSGTDAEGDTKRLDVVVDLPNGRHLVIDSKTSLRSYEDAVNLVDDAARELALQAHIEALRDHARDLGKKRYQDLYGINAPDFVLMYIPIEAAYLSALSRVPSLFAEALDDNIVLITNSSLLGTLRTVSNVWQLADQQKNATDIAERGGALYDKFVGFVENMQAVGKAIDASQEAWSDANKQLHTGRGNLVSQASKLRALGAKSTKLLSPELTESAVESSDTAAVLTAAEKKGLPAPAASPSSN